MNEYYDLPKLIDPALIQRASQFGSAELADGMKGLGIPQDGCLDASILPIDEHTKMVGTAYTVDTKDGDNFPIHVAIYSGKPGYVLMVDGKGYQVRYMEQLVAHNVERDPENVWEHLERLFRKDKKFFSSSTRKEHIPTGDNLKSFLSDQLEQLKPEVQKYVAETVGYMLNACVTPLLDCYQQLDQQLASLAAKLDGLRF